ncbi:hypothetical protein BCON_0298g00020 [Botryotinia convoluta]|uniref:J domain-containing protein n=1 Tax=Botryotinia convoluta TaxID=54673 RepID=A0A4Z1HD16_9HELO|nr:hypothetical protein BCON_0298g00020 [Botryotinia convoluta]
MSSTKSNTVCSGTHPRFGVFSQPDPGAHITGTEASKEVDVEFKKIGFEELKTKKGLNSMPKSGKKTRKKGYAEQTILDAEDLRGARYSHDPDMDYYEVLSLDSSASIEDINKAYSELRWTHNPESDEGKTKWHGKEPTILQDMKQKWINIQRAFIILSNHDRKWSYDNDREMRLKRSERKDKKPDESTAQFSAKNQKAMDKARSEWNQKLISYMILKDEKLRKKYNEHNNSHKFYEYLQKEHDSKELERVHTSLVLASERMERRGKSVSSQPATTGNSFRRLSTETNDDFIEGVSDDGASASDMMTRVEQNTEIDYSVAITSTEKLSDRVQVNPPTITDRIPKLMSQAFSISKVPLQNKFTNQNAQLSSGSLKSSTLQRKLLQAREIQAQRVVQEKKAQSKLTVQVTERSAKFSKEVRTQHPAVQDQVPKILRDQQAFVQKQLNAQRAAA